MPATSRGMLDARSGQTRTLSELQHLRFAVRKARKSLKLWTSGSRKGLQHVLKKMEDTCSSKKSLWRSRHCLFYELQDKTVGMQRSLEFEAVNDD